MIKIKSLPNHDYFSRYKMKQSTKKYLYSIGKTPLEWKGRVRSESSLQTVMNSVAIEIVDLEKKEFTVIRLCPMTVNEKFSIKFKQIVLVSLNV